MPNVPVPWGIGCKYVAIVFFHEVARMIPASPTDASNPRQMERHGLFHSCGRHLSVDVARRHYWRLLPPLCL